MGGRRGEMSRLGSKGLARILLCLLADAEWGVTDQAQMQVDLGDSVRLTLCWLAKALNIVNSWLAR